jgi:hypothetical protein
MKALMAVGRQTLYLFKSAGNARRSERRQRPALLFSLREGWKPAGGDAARLRAKPDSLVRKADAPVPKCCNIWFCCDQSRFRTFPGATFANRT